MIEPRKKTLPQYVSFGILMEQGQRQYTQFNDAATIK